MQFGAHILDLYLAPKLSELQDCNPPDLSELPHYRGSLVLNHIFCGVAYPDELRVPISLFISRLREATAEYRMATKDLKAYIAALPDHGQLGAHTRSVAHFETCIMKADLAATLLKSVGTRIGEGPLWSTGDGSTLERIHLASNRIKHFDEDIAKAVKKKEALPLAPIWLVRTGIECSRCLITFDELAFVLKEMAEDAEILSEKWPALAVERRRKQFTTNSQSGSTSADHSSQKVTEPGKIITGHIQIAIPEP